MSDSARRAARASASASASAASAGYWYRARTWVGPGLGLGLVLRSCKGADAGAGADEGEAGARARRHDRCVSEVWLGCECVLLVACAYCARSIRWWRAHAVLVLSDAAQLAVSLQPLSSHRVTSPAESTAEHRRIPVEGEGRRECRAPPPTLALGLSTG